MKNLQENNKRQFIIEYLPLLFILVSGAILRILFFKSIPGPIQVSDSETYIGGAKNLFQYLWLDEFRPPAYLIQLILTGIIFSWEMLEFGAILLQNLIGLLSVIILYKLVKEVTGSRTVGYLAAFFSAISFRIYCWDFMILTENLSIFLVTLTTYTLILYMKYNNSKHIKALWAILLICIFTKPFFMVLPVLVAILLMIRRLVVEKKNLISGIKTVGLGLAGIYFCLVVYSSVNLFQHSFFGITTVGKVNTFGKVLQYKMEHQGNNDKLMGDVKEAFSTASPEFIVNGKFLEPWHFIGTYGWNKNHYKEIGSFASEIILKKPVEYTIKSLLLTWNLLVNSPFEDYIADFEVEKAGHPNRIMLAVKKVTDAFGSLYILLLLCGLEILVQFLFHRKYLFLGNEFYLLTLFLVILYHYIISAFFSYGDYCRLLAPCYPLIYAIITIYICRPIKFLWNLRES